MRPPTLADSSEKPWIGWLIQSEYLAGGHLERPIAGGPYVGPPETREQVDVGRPWSDSRQGGEAAMDLLVGQPVQPREVERSIDHPLAEHSRVPGLLTAEAVGTQVLVARCQDGSRRHFTTHPFRQTVEGRFCRSERDLLLEDEEDERRESGCPVPEIGFAGRLHRPAEIRIGRAQHRHGTPKRRFVERPGVELVVVVSRFVCQGMNDERRTTA